MKEVKIQKCTGNGSPTAVMIQCTVFNLHICKHALYILKVCDHKQ